MLLITFNLIEFSTNIADAKNFVISQIEVEEKYNLNFNKIKVIDRGFQRAFEDLSMMILEKKDYQKLKDTPIEDIKKLIESFSILDEKFVNKKYKNIMEVQFNKNKLIKYFNSKNVISSLPKNIDVFFLPVLVDVETNSLNFLNDNVLLEGWENVKKNYFQISYNLPNEDIEDYQIIKKNLKNIENYNFKEIIKKYDMENYIIMIILKKQDTVHLFSKIKFDEKFIILNKSFTNINIYDQNDLSTLVLEIKNRYEDYWKSTNKIDLLNSVTIRLSLNSKNVKKSIELEKALSNLDFVNDFKIEKFDNKELIYKINYSSNPKRFLKDILFYNIEVDTSSVNWKINE